MGLILYRTEEAPGRCDIIHVRHAERNIKGYLRIVWSDWLKVWARIVYWAWRIFCFVHYCFARKESYRQNHGYPEYWERLTFNKDELSSMTLDECYADFRAEKGKLVKTRYW